MSQYAVYRELGEETSAKVQRISIDIPSNLVEWKILVRDHPIVLLYIWKQSCMPCVQIKNRFEQWIGSLKQRYRDDQGWMLFVKDCLDRDGPQPQEGTPSAVHNRMAQMVPFYILYYDNQIVYKHAGFEPHVLEEYIDMCVQDLVQRQKAGSSPPQDVPLPPAPRANIEFFPPDV